MAIQAPSWEDWQANMTHIPSGSVPSSRLRRDYYDNFVNEINNASSDDYARQVIREHSLQVPGGGGGSSGGGGGGSSRPSVGVGDTSRNTPRQVDLDALRREREAQAAAAKQAAMVDARNRLYDDFRNYGINLDATMGEGGWEGGGAGGWNAQTGWGEGTRATTDRFGWENSNYGRIIDDYLNQIGDTIGVQEQSPENYFGKNMFGDLRTQIESDTRERFGRDMDQFAGRSITDAMFGDQYGMDTTNSILDQQYGDTQATLDRARDRGQLSTNAYDRAVGDLTNSRGAGEQRLGDLRSGLIDDYRNQLGTVGDRGYNALSEFDLGDQFNPQDYQTQINDRFNSLQQGFEGDFRKALGNEKVFDWNTLINTANVNAGAENQKKYAPLQVAALADQQKEDDQTRGIGGSGVF